MNILCNIFVLIVMSVEDMGYLSVNDYLLSFIFKSVEVSLFLSKS